MANNSWLWCSNSFALLKFGKEVFSVRSYFLCCVSCKSWVRRRREKCRNWGITSPLGLLKWHLEGFYRRSNSFYACLGLSSECQGKYECSYWDCLYPLSPILACVPSYLNLLFIGYWTVSFNIVFPSCLMEAHRWELGHLSSIWILTIRPHL